MQIGEILGWVGTTLDMLGIRNFIAAFVVVLLVAATIRQLFNKG